MDHVLTRLRAIESAARGVYTSAKATNGKATFEQWAKLGDALDDVALSGASADSIVPLIAALQDARSALVAAQKALQPIHRWAHLSQHLLEVIDECNAVLPVNHPDAFARGRT